jgi:hypothetical protein
MNVITVKRPLRKGTRDTMVNMSYKREYRRSLLFRVFRQIRSQALRLAETIQKILAILI